MRPPQQLAAAFLLALSATLALYRPAGAAAGMVVTAATLAVLLLLARVGTNRGALALSRDAVPFAAVVVLYTHLQPAVEALNTARYDALFGGLDQRYFAGLAEAWRGAFGRPGGFTDASYIAYASFYLLPVVTLLWLRAQKERAVFERASFTVVLGFCLSYVGYVLWPTSGPRLGPAEEAALGGGAVSEAIRAFLRWGGVNLLDAFPSGHTAISLLTALVATRPLGWRTIPLWAWAAAVVFSTVYIHVHYVSDLLGGLALVGVTLLLAPAVWWALERLRPPYPVAPPRP
ncbi:MAG TPA: phosphatase PAP2 family protein [Anaeromyxobacter sp.]|nr:phosphatase PAP2 family protein [Anaeromyxobacter sp.]